MAESTTSFGTLDYIVFSSSIILSLAIGVYQWYRSRGGDTRDYLMGGSGVPIVALILSLLAGIVSPTSILGSSSEMFYYGTQLWMNCAGMFIGCVLVITIIIPVLFPLRLISMYEYFEIRWKDQKLRKLAMILQLFHFITNSGITLYGPSLALSSVTPIASSTSVIIMGIVSTLYSSFGGAKAVIYTDTFQSFIMFAGVVAVIVQGCKEVGGIGNAWSIDKEYERIDFFNLSTDPFKRHTLLWNTILGTFVCISMYGASQPQFQRWGSVATLRRSLIVVVLSMVGVISFWSLNYFAGLVVFSVYADCDPLSAGDITSKDQVIVHFVADKLGNLPGVLGLFVAAVYSAVLSSVSSDVNGNVAIIWKDLLQPLPYFSVISEDKAKTYTICISLVTGMFSILVGLVAGNLGGLIQATLSIGGALSSPVVGLYFTAILCPWVKSWSAFLGAVCALSLNMWITMGHFLYGPPTPMLPLSTQGCPPLNTSIITSTTTSLLTSPTTSLLTSPTAADPRDPEVSEVFPLYQLTYCLYGAIGLFTTITMSSLFSCVLGFADPNTVPPNTVNQTCLRFYYWLRGVNMPVVVDNKEEYNCNSRRTSINTFTKTTHF